MALFGKKKQDFNVDDPENKELEDMLNAAQEEQDKLEAAMAGGESLSVESGIDTEPSADNGDKTPEELFQDRVLLLAQRVRMMFPQQMLIGFYYAELQSEGYIDDLCCYTTKAELLEKSDIPARTGMSLPDMVSREEKLQQAFFLFRKAAELFTKKACNAVSLTMLGDGQVKVDITSEPLVEGEEDIRYGKWREMVEKTELRPAAAAPRQIPKEKLDQIQKQAESTYEALGTEFFSFLPDDVDYKVAYFYAENNENGIFYFNRMIMNDGEIIDGDDMFDRFEMDKEEAQANRLEIINKIMDLSKVFADNGEPPFTNITLTVTPNGEFSSNMEFNPVSAQTEQKRLEHWKEDHKE
ncbi:MAG: DUF600 family protein [Ruminococcus sp.]|nr:DUF600 family protein [Ruminococcus sp.]